MREKRKKSFFRKIVSFVMTIAFVLVIAAGAGSVYLKIKLDDVSHVDADREAMCPSQSVDGIVNVALLGVDARDMNNYSGTRTDSIIIVSMNSSSKEIDLISVYRDTYLDIEGVGSDKVTHAFAYGGAERTLNTLNRNMDLDITRFAALNFRTVAEVVDGVGGIDIYIEEDEVDQINRYLSSTARYLDSDYEYIKGSGMNHLDGVQAVTYSRIRSTEGGDYRRTERMRNVLSACFAQLKKMGPVQINEMLNDVLPDIYSNMSSLEMMRIMVKVPFMEIKKSTGWPYDKEGYTDARGIWYAAPVTLCSNVERLHREVFLQHNYDAPLTVENISSRISYETGYYNQ